MDTYASQVSGAHIWDLEVVGTTIYAAGKFTHAGGQAASGVAKWNGNAWSALGTGSTNEVFAVTGFKDHLYIGGQFPRSESGRSYVVNDAKGNLLANAAQASRTAACDGR